MANERTAVVIGASMGGLLAARVLSERFGRVVVLERDALAADGQPRKGVPQGRHAHGLLARGREILEELFPGLTAELEARGALRGDLGLDTGWWHAGTLHLPHASGIVGLLVSRPVLEGAVLRRVRALPNVELVERCDVLGLEGGGPVSGVRFLRRAPGAAVETLSAELTVDASGRGSRLPAWLARAGWAPPPEEELKVDLGYATRLYRRRPGQLGGRSAVVIAASPEVHRAGVALAMEGERWIVSFGGYAGDHAPLDDRGFTAYASRLPAPELADLLREAEPLSEPFRYRYSASLRRRYERLRRFPEGLLAFGDALCSFNPIYGQGMSVAALEALALRECLARGWAGLAPRFFRRAARIVDIPWSIAAVSDLRFPEVEGRRGPMVRFVNWYLAKLHVAARTDRVVSHAFLRLTNLLAPPASVLRPGIVLRVLRAHLRAEPSRDGEEAAPARPRPVVRPS
jgi:2-polyprenyl-6-methoxyphenol hydroxylase-like FAD-dependent oxidoreductase